MEDFQNEKKRIDTLIETFPDVYQNYPEYVTQQQANLTHFPYYKDTMIHE